MEDIVRELAFSVDIGTFVWALGWFGYGVGNEVWLDSLVYGSSLSFSELVVNVVCSGGII